MALISKRVRALREEKGWSRATLAFKCGYSENWLTHIEQGINLPSLTGLLALSKALEVSPGDLLDSRGDDVTELAEKLIRSLNLDLPKLERLIRIARIIFQDK